MVKHQTEVVIAGSGPAGATLAYLLARSGVKVVLVEPDSTFTREFRGPAYQPILMQLFNEMGILDEILSTPHTTIHEISLLEKNKTLLKINFDQLKGGYNYAVSMQQGPLLKKLIQLAGEFPSFTFLGNASVTDLLFEEGAVTGVTVNSGNDTFSIKSQLVVGCDGRFSKVREKANIELEKSQGEFDLVWFELPPAKGQEYSLELQLGSQGLAVIIPEENGTLRIGYSLPKGSYSKLQADGIEDFKEKLKIVLPKLSKHIQKNLSSFNQCSLLDVKVALAKRWVQDGLLLCGDSAHTASPVGAQGNKLAICDAVVYHPYIVDALNNSDAPVSTKKLMPAVKIRMKEVKKTFALQSRMAKLILAKPNSFFSKVIKKLIPKISPYVAPRILKTIAFGTTPIHVNVKKFKFQTEYGRLHRYYMLKVCKIVQETPNCVSYYLEVPPELTLEYSYLPGQFVTLRVLEEGQLFKRCYSLSSCPEEDDALRITIKRVDKGLISNDLINHVKIGDELLVLPPAGQMTPSPTATKYILIAGGSGIAPLYSILRSMLLEPYIEKMTLIYSNSNKESIIFFEDLEKLLKEHPNRFTLHHHITETEGKISQDKLRKQLPEIDKSTAIYLCGPAGLMDLSAYAANAAGATPGQLHREIYASIKESYEAAPIDDRPLIVGTGEDVEEAHEIEIKLNGKSSTLTCENGDSILDAAIDANLNPPYSCREGICSTCVATLVEGKVSMEKHQSLSSDDAEDMQILTCQAKPLTKKCVIDYN